LKELKSCNLKQGEKTQNAEVRKTRHTCQLKSKANSPKWFSAGKRKGRNVGILK